MRGDIQVGARLPDYELPDQDGIMRRLSDLQGSNPMLLHLSRGGFDPHRGDGGGSEAMSDGKRRQTHPERGARPKRCPRPEPRSDQAPPVNDRASAGATTRS